MNRMLAQAKSLSRCNIFGLYIDSDIGIKKQAWRAEFGNRMGLSTLEMKITYLFEWDTHYGH
jgi:lysozyme family protein